MNPCRKQHKMYSNFDYFENHIHYIIWNFFLLHLSIHLILSFDMNM